MTAPLRCFFGSAALLLAMGEALAAPASPAGSAQRAVVSPPKVVAGRVVGAVLQVTDREVYFNFGSQLGVKVGDLVTVERIDGERGRVALVEVYRRGARARIDPEDALPRLFGGASAVYRGPKAKAQRPVKLPAAPEPLERLRRRWASVTAETRPWLSPPARPSAGTAVPTKTRDVRGLFVLSYLGLYDLDHARLDHFHQLDLYSSLDVTRLGAPWLDYSHRLGLRFDLAADRSSRPFDEHRFVARIRRLRLGATRGRLRAELGRLAGASLADAATIDGVKLRTRLSPGWSLGAFGGLAPRFSDLRPRSSAWRFGAGAAFRHGSEEAGALRAAVDLGYFGSTWYGLLDRQALSARADLALPFVELRASAVVDLYGADHPAGRPAAELSWLTVDAASQAFSWLRLGLRYDRYRFVITRETLEALGREGYNSGNVHGSLRGSVDLALPWAASLSLLGGGDWEAGEASAAWVSLYTRKAGLLLVDDRLSVSFDATLGSLFDGAGGRLHYSLALTEALDLSLGYGLRGYRYGEENETLLRHRLTAGAELQIRHDLLALIDLATLIGDEERTLELFASLSWRL